MNKFPFISLQSSVIGLRIFTACIFLAHAVVRISGGTIDRFGGFLEEKGLPFGVVLVWLITIFELAGSLLLIAGRFTKNLSLGFIVLLFAGIALIHAGNGWFVGEHGTGGVEYSALLIVAFIVIAAGDNNRR